MTLKRINKVIIFVVFLVLISCLIGCKNTNTERKNVGLAWCAESNYGHTSFAVHEAGGEATLLKQVKYNGVKYDQNNKVDSSCVDDKGILKPEYAQKIKERHYEDTNVKEVVANQKAIIFSGGADICPTLYKNPQEYLNIGEKPSFDATRDISDYILMAYCLDYNIPVVGLCRGMQLYAVVEGGEMIQDLSHYYASKNIPYNDEHKKSGEIDGKEIRGNHPVYITDNSSFISDIYKKDVLENPYSSHHQAVLSVDPQKSKVVAQARVNGLETIEALERTNSDVFSLFVQYHPEHSAAHWKDHDADRDSFMSLAESLQIFMYLLNKI